MTATTPYTLPARNRPAGVPLQIGTGVVVDQIKRQRDAFADLELRQQTEKQARWEAVANGLRQVEGVLTEPSDHGLQNMISSFFNSWSELSNNPSSTALRTVVQANGEALTVQFNDVAKRLLSTRQDIDSAIAARVPEINDLGTQLASLNDQIMKSVSSGDIPNDLRDKRDLILDQLAKLAGSTYREEARGSTTVLIGGRVFVNGNIVSQMTTETQTVATGILLHQLRWAQDNTAVNIEGGELKGQLELRDTRMPEKIKQLNLLATSIVNNVNQLHKGGVGTDLTTTNVNFFDPMTQGSSTLNITGVGDDITSGNFTIGGPGGAQTVAINPTVDTVSGMLTKISAAINAAGGAGTSSSASIDPTSGKLIVQYTKAGGPPAITFGANGDTSNFLQVFGIQGAPVATSGTTATVVGLEPVAVVRAASMTLDSTVRTDVTKIAATPLGVFVDPATAADLVPTKGIELVTSSGTPTAGSYQVAVTPTGVPAGTTYTISVTLTSPATTVTLTGQTPPASGAQNTLDFDFGSGNHIYLRVNSKIGSTTIGAGSTSQFEYISPANGAGDNRLALAIASLQRKRLGALDAATFEDYYASNTGKLGVEARQADQIGQNEKLLAEHLEKRRQSVAGVSLDEEAIQLIRYQRAYQAAARGISAVDEMLETIISRMGRVGL
jgi:flagellar hook-associated protein 1 FlgK